MVAGPGCRDGRHARWVYVRGPEGGLFFALVAIAVRLGYKLLRKTGWDMVECPSLRLRSQATRGRGCGADRACGSLG